MKNEFRLIRQSRGGYRIVVTKYNGRSTSVESFGPMSWNDAQRAVRHHGVNFHAEVQAVDDDSVRMTVAYGAVSYR
jgi:hypothetical protein